MILQYLILAACIPSMLLRSFESQAQVKPPLHGTVVAEYRSKGSDIPSIYAIDLATKAAFLVWPGERGTHTILLQTPSKQVFTGEAGVSTLIPSDKSQITYDALDEAFPFVLPVLLEELPTNTVSITTLDDGSTNYTCDLIGGSLGLTIKGLPEGFSAESKKVYYLFDSNGRLKSIIRHATNNTEIIDYIEDAPDPKLAIPKSFANGGWVLHNYEIFPKGRPDLFTPETVTTRARKMLVTYNKHKADLAQSPELKSQLEISIKQLEGDSAPLRIKRFALILTGLIVIAVGSLAWWKNRS